MSLAFAPNNVCERNLSLVMRISSLDCALRSTPCWETGGKDSRFALHKRSRSQSKDPSKKSSGRRQASTLHHEEHGKKILERRRFSLLVGIMIGCCIVLLSDYTGLHKVPIPRH